MTTQDTVARLEQIRESFTTDDIDWLIGEVYRLTAEHDEVYRSAQTAERSVSSLILRLTDALAERDEAVAQLAKERRANEQLAGALAVAERGWRIAQDARYRLSAELYELRAGLPEWRCPSCGATTRARMADHQDKEPDRADDCHAEPLDPGTAAAMLEVIDDTNRRIERVRRVFGEEPDRA